MRLTPDLLIAGYCQGLFPMAGDDGEIGWYDPNPRAIIPLDAFHASKRLARRVRNGGFEIRIDHDFRAVMTACAEPRPATAGAAAASAPSCLPRAATGRHAARRRERNRE